jgi:hypothetical protein
MAQQLPRIYFQNVVTIAGTTLAASSEQTPVYGVTNLRDPTPTRTWRSKLGWNVVSGFNNKIYFLEGASSRVGTIALGNYASGTAYAAAVTTAMNTAPGHTNTYLVSYNTTTKIFTIARTAGAATVTLQFASISFQDSCHKDMAFDNVNQSGGTSYSPLLPAYKSREWVSITGFSPGSASARIVYNCNFGSSAVFGEINSSGTFENFTPPSQLSQVSATLLNLIPVSAVAGGFCRITIEDVSFNTSGYSEIGLIFVGHYLQLGRTFVQGWTLTLGQLSQYAISDTGTVFQDLKASPRAWSLEWHRLSTSNRNSLISFQNDNVRVGGSFFIHLDPLNVSTDLYYVYMTSPLQFTQRVGDGTPPDRYDVAGFQITEHL